MTDDSATTCTPHPPPTADGSPRSFDTAWRTETVLALAKGIEAESAFDRMPILADALEEAGCDDELLLQHCRQCGQHAVECWVVYTILELTVVPLVPAPRVRQAVQSTRTDAVDPTDPYRLTRDFTPRQRFWMYVIGFLIAIPISFALNYPRLTRQHQKPDVNWEQYRSRFAEPDRNTPPTKFHPRIDP